MINYSELESLYSDLENASLRLWEMLYHPDNFNSEDYRAKVQEMVTTEVHSNYVKITVLPRVVGLTNTTLNTYWYEIMHNALSGLDVRYEQILCVIKIIEPDKYRLMDDRATKIITQSLQSHRIIASNRRDNMSLMVTSGMDHENPRTEIYLTQHPNDDLFFVDK